jgi:hypothetical protein
MVLAEAEVVFGCGNPRVRLLFNVEVPQLGAHQGEHDILEVVVRAMLALERRSPESRRCGRHWSRCQHCSGASGRGNGDGLAFRVVDAMPTLLPKEMVFAWSAMATGGREAGGGRLATGDGRGDRQLARQKELGALARRPLLVDAPASPWCAPGPWW